MILKLIGIGCLLGLLGALIFGGILAIKWFLNMGDPEINETSGSRNYENYNQKES